MSIEHLLILKRPPLPKIARIGLGLTIAGIGVVALRYAGVRRYNGAERLAEALLDSDMLHDAARNLEGPEGKGSETVLAACATYLVSVAYRAAIGEGVATEDPINYSRTHEHPYTHATVTVLTESHTPEHLLTYAVNLPEVGEVRGTRRVGPLHTAGLTPARPAIDTVQITLPHGYTAQLESEFEIADYLVTGQTRLFGAATLRDNVEPSNNVARINIAYDGGVSGTITRDGHVIGRFEGKVTTGVTFRQYEIGPGA